GENTLAQVAERLNMDLDDLRNANPQVADPNSLNAGQEIRLPRPGLCTPAGIPPASTTGDVADRTFAPDVSKRMDTKLDGNVMRALLNFGASPANNSGPGASTPVHGTGGPAAGTATAPAGKTPDELQALNDNADFKNLSPAQQTLVKQTLTANPPVSQDKVQKTID